MGGIFLLYRTPHLAGFKILSRLTTSKLHIYDNQSQITNNKSIAKTAITYSKVMADTWTGRGNLYSVDKFTKKKSNFMSPY